MDLTTPGDDVDTKLIQKHERKQASALLECFKSEEEGSLASDGWKWPVAGRCVPAAAGRGAVADVDALLFVPHSGLVVMEFKDKREPSTEDLRQVDRQAQAISSACRAIIDTWDTRHCSDVPQLPPPILRAVGYFRLRQKSLSNWQSRNSAVFDRAAAVIGSEAWDVSQSVRDRSTHLRDLIHQAFSDFSGNYLLRSQGEYASHQAFTEAQYEYLLTRLRDDLPATTGIRDYLEQALLHMDVSTESQSRGGWHDIEKGWADPESRVITMGGEEVSVVWYPGLAGTGKTWTALYAAVVQAAQGRRVLLTCRSPEVQRFMIGTLIGLLDEVEGGLEQIDVLRPEQLVASERFEWHSRESWQGLRAMSGSYDAVLVDEAQDFGGLTSGDQIAIDFVLDLLRQEGQGALFADPSQATLDGSVGVTQSDAKGRALERRTRNLRSTPEIVDFIEQSVGCGYFLDPLARHRLNVRIHECASRELQHVLPALMDLMRTAASEMQFASGVLPPSRSVVLVEDEHELQRLRRTPDLARDLAALEWATIDSFKGLERDFVLLPLTSHSLTSDVDRFSALAYTGFSRARLWLGVVAPKEAGLRLPRHS